MNLWQFLLEVFGSILALLSFAFIGVFLAVFIFCLLMAP